MGKYNLGKATTKSLEKIVNEGLMVNENKANGLIIDINKQLDNINTSLHKINILLNRATTLGLVKGARATAFRGWAKKSKAQADNALRIKDKLNDKYLQDVREYPIKLLDDRIAELEKQIKELTNNM